LSFPVSKDTLTSLGFLIEVNATDVENDNILDEKLDEESKVDKLEEPSTDSIQKLISQKEKEIEQLKAQLQLEQENMQKSQKTIEIQKKQIDYYVGYIEDSTDAKSISYSEFNSIYRDLMEEEQFNFSQSKKLVLGKIMSRFEVHLFLPYFIKTLNFNTDMTKHKSRNFVEAIMDKRLPPFELLQFDSVSSNSEALKRLISNCRAGHPNKLYFNYPSNKFITGEKYLRALCRAASTGRYEEFSTCNCLLTNEEFWKLMEAKKRCVKIEFFFCTLETKEPMETKDILKGSTFEFIAMQKTGASSRSNWAVNPNWLENIIKGLGQSEDVRKSLKKIDILKSGLETEEVKRMMEENGLEKVEIVRT
jgi:hypothetical protein